MAPDVEVHVVGDLHRACAESDIIVTATAATTPIVEARSIQPGTHITAVGADAPGKHELEPQLLERADLLAVDSRSQCIDHGELSAIAHSDAVSSAVEIGELLAGHPGRRSGEAITIADLTGIAAQDIAAADCVLGVVERNRSV